MATTSNGTAAANGSTGTKAPTFEHYPSATKNFTIPLMANDNVYLGDIFTASFPHSDSEAEHLTSGLFRMTPGQPLDYAYEHHEMKYIVEGDITITDLETGRSVQAGQGDVFHFSLGARIRFETTNGGMAFYTEARKME